MHEPRLTSWLGRQEIGSFAEIVGADDARQWWLAEDFGGHPATQSDHPAVVARLADIQRALAGRTDAAVALGCPRRSIGDLAAGVPAVLDRADLWDAAPALANLHRALDSAAAATLRRSAAVIEAACADVAAAGLPETLLHTDFHPGNAVLRDHGVLLHDWSCAEAGPAMLDIATWCYRASDDDALAAATAYAAGWADVATGLRAWRSVRIAGSFAQLAQFVRLADLVGSPYAFNFLPVVYGWARRLNVLTSG